MSTFLYPSKLVVLVLLVLAACSEPPPAYEIQPNQRIALVGGNLGSRMMNYGHFETELHARFPEHRLYIRNMCDGGDTPGFRPHSGRNDPWAFPGAEQFQTELAHNSGSEGHFEKPDEWLSRLNTDLVIAFFGFSESYQGPEGLPAFKDELQAFIDHTLKQTYHQNPALLALVSPTAFEDLSEQFDLPDGIEENKRLQLYTQAISEIAERNNLPFIDAYNNSLTWYQNESTPLTVDGAQLNDRGYQLLSKLMVDQLFGGKPQTNLDYDELRNLVLEKNWFWHNDYKIPNGVHVFGRRYNPFGPDNYPDELIKIRQMTANRDSAIWAFSQGVEYDLPAADEQTHTLPPVETNFEVPQGQEMPQYKYGAEALQSFTLAPGYQIELFASEEDFDDLANPVQLSFDNRGRLWVATMPGYPHYKPGDPMPNDKIIILEDTDNDGKADKQTTFLDGLHLPTGFEITEHGVYVSQGTNLMLYQDTDGDDRADHSEVVLSGFDDHDTHHVISAFSADPSGAIYMAEGVFLHTNVETAYGPVRATNGGFFRYNPNRKRLERTAQVAIPNPWGIAFDEYGQNFFCETSGPDVRWMMPATIKSRYGVATHKSFNLIEDAHRVRPTSGIEFVSSRHFPPEVQGDLLINNTIGFLGTKQHTMLDDTTGYVSRFRQDLLKSSDFNFRPVDMEFAPDGSLYLVDWHNILVGHMQHNARDPLRDHEHGRIYRITYPGRPLVTPPKIHGASIPELLENLTLHEYRARYRTRRELRSRQAAEVLPALNTWIQNLDPSHPKYEHHLLEALWVTWGLNQPDFELLEQLLKAKDFRVRTAAIRVLRFTAYKTPEAQKLFKIGAQDPSSRVRLETLVAASWLEKDQGLELLELVKTQPMDNWMLSAFETSQAHLNNQSVGEKLEEQTQSDLEGTDLELFLAGKNLYQKDGFCITCHQADGKGLDASQFPPLANTPWVLGNKERLIKIVLHGLRGPIEVNGKEYPGQVPMTPYKGLMNDEEMAAVLTFVRNSFGNKADPVYPEEVRAVRAKTSNKRGFYDPQELLQQHPMEIEN